MTKSKLSKKRIRGIEDVDEEFNDLVVASEASWRNLLQDKYRPHLTMAIMIPFFQQLTGINMILYQCCLRLLVLVLMLHLSAMITGGVNFIDVVSIYYSLRPILCDTFRISRFKQV
ncbi:hypothetical protein AABB24_033307 [Solanum stoloniferum]|uniref:Uncharacterized protein n=1 Tax=Solanum stoloniferum TaxID=62892 RepID=A0ABD2RND5_9SOLN